MKRIPACLFLVGLCSGCAEVPPCAVAPVDVARHRGNAACFIEHRGRVLLVEHRFGGEVGLPGGRSRAEESARCTAHREVWEETGLDVVVGELLDRSTNTFVYQCSLAAVADAHPSLPWWGRLEVTALRWVDAGDMRSLDWRYRGDRRQVQKLMESTEGS